MRQISKRQPHQQGRGEARSALQQGNSPSALVTPFPGGMDLNLILFSDFRNRKHKPGTPSFGLISNF